MRRRSGFTLIEVMIAMALTLFVMVILSQAFVISLDTFSGMKGLGDMQINLRTAEVMLRDDLTQDHFSGKRRLSDPNIVTQPPLEGFFAVRHSSNFTAAPAPAPPAPHYYREGFDPFGLPSYRANDQMIYMTVKRKGNRQESFYNTAIQSTNTAMVDNFFSQATAYNLTPAELANHTWAPPYQAGTGSGIYASQWIEVIYYLKRTGTSEVPNDPSALLGTPTFGLYRAQWVMAPDASKLSGKFANGLEASTFAGMSCNPAAGGLAFYSPTDAAKGQRVIQNLAPTAFDIETGFGSGRLRKFDTNGAIIRETLVLPNVVSFHVQVMPLTPPGVGGAFIDVPNNPGPGFGIYDTTKFGPAGAAAGYGSQQFGIKAIQITLRVWDNKTRQTRQATIVQDL